MDMTTAELEDFARTCMSLTVGAIKDGAAPPGPLAYVLSDGQVRVIMLPKPENRLLHRAGARALGELICEVKASVYAVVSNAWAAPAPPDGNMKGAASQQPDRFEIMFVYAENRERAVMMYQHVINDEDGSFKDVAPDVEKTEALPHGTFSNFLLRGPTLQ